MTDKNVPAEIIKLTELFSVGFELHSHKHFNLLGLLLLFYFSYLAQHPLLYSILVELHARREAEPHS